MATRQRAESEVPMRLHPAVACTMLVVGGAFLLAPILVWAYLVRNIGLYSASTLPAPIVMSAMLGTLLGAALVVIAVIFAFIPRDRSEPE
jgi:hypothetical protein